MKYTFILFLCMGLGFIGLKSASFKEFKKLKFKKENCINSHILAFFQFPCHVKFKPVSPASSAASEKEKEDLVQKISIELNSFQVDRLQQFLLSSENFIWNKTKRGVFLPTSAFYFEKGKESLIVLVSVPLNQIQLIVGQQEVILDYDPMQAAFNSYIDELIKELEE